jgi:hypothetical protein
MKTAKEQNKKPNRKSFQGFSLAFKGSIKDSKTINPTKVTSFI